MSYRDIWQSLEFAAREQKTGYVRRRLKPQSVCDIFLAIASPSEQHMLQIKLTETPIARTDLPSTRGLEVNLLYSGDEQKNVTLQLTLKEKRFENIFDALIEDIVEVVDRAQSEATAVVAFISRLWHWQKFLEQVGPEGLSKEAQQGLYGELWFLREKLIPLIGPYPAILAWVGPGGAHQDFMQQLYAIEIKTTGTKEPQHLIIQSERQLDDIGLDALFLVHLSLDVREGTGESLIMIVDSLREILKIDNAALELYEDRLLEAGFIQAQALNYETTGYYTRYFSLFHVKDSFPRIISSNLHPGIGSVRYSIAVSECRHFTVTENELKSQLTGQKYGK